MLYILWESELYSLTTWCELVLIWYSLSLGAVNVCSPSSSLPLGLMKCCLTCL